MTQGRAYSLKLGTANTPFDFLGKKYQVRAIPKPIQRLVDYRRASKLVRTMPRRRQLKEIFFFLCILLGKAPRRKCSKQFVHALGSCVLFSGKHQCDKQDVKTTSCLPLPLRKRCNCQHNFASTVDYALWNKF